MVRTRLIVCSFAVTTLLVSPALGQELTVDMSRISAEGIGEKVGTAKVTEAPGGGVTFEVSVQGLSGGERGFHVHQNGDCGPGERDGQQLAGLAAGGHFDPQTTGKHAGPGGDGHLGDLPKLKLNSDGTPVTVTAPRLRIADIRGRALVIHEGGDTYSDQPELGGGGARIVCGVVPP